MEATYITFRNLLHKGKGKKSYFANLGGEEGD